jgi:hypothetical protein
VNFVVSLRDLRVNFLNTKCTKFFTKNTKIQTNAESFLRFIRTIADGRAFNSFVAPLILLIPWLRFKADHGSKGTKTEQEEFTIEDVCTFWFYLPLI